MGFSSDLVPLIKNRSKILTYRLGNKFNILNVGDQIEVIDSSINQPFGIVEIIQKSFDSFINLPINRSGHEIYKSKEEMRKIFEGYYNQVIKDHDKFLVIKFKVLNIY